MLAAVATGLLWNRMRGPRPARLLQRAALLVFGELMAAMAILVWVNISNGGLVVSWQDLLGNQSTRGGVFAGPARRGRARPAGAAPAATAARRGSACRSSDARAVPPGGATASRRRR